MQASRTPPWTVSCNMPGLLIQEQLFDCQKKHDFYLYVLTGCNFLQAVR